VDTAHALPRTQPLPTTAPRPAARPSRSASTAALPADHRDHRDGGLATVARAAQQHVTWPAGLLLLVVGFLVVQNRIDRKDPKLRVLPVWSEEELEFALPRRRPRVPRRVPVAVRQVPGSIGPTSVAAEQRTDT
jgi:hypothetical protein